MLTSAYTSIQGTYIFLKNLTNATWQQNETVVPARRILSTGLPLPGTRPGERTLVPQGRLRPLPLAWHCL